MTLSYHLSRDPSGSSCRKCRQTMAKRFGAPASCYTLVIFARERGTVPFCTSWCLLASLMASAAAAAAAAATSAPRRARAFRTLCVCVCLRGELREACILLYATAERVILRLTEEYLCLLVKGGVCVQICPPWPVLRAPLRSIAVCCRMCLTMSWARVLVCPAYCAVQRPPTALVAFDVVCFCNPSPIPRLFLFFNCKCLCTWNG